MSITIGTAISPFSEIPNPYAAACLHRRAVPRCAGKRWWTQHERRSQVFAVSRKLLGECGAEKFSMRCIAEHCNISLQTIYNIAGDRGEVMREAIVEHIQWTAANSAFNEVSEPAALLDFLNMLVASVVSYPQYNANAARFAGGQAAATFTCNSALSAQLSRFLANLRVTGRLRPPVLINPLACQMAELLNTTICRWALHPYESGQFHRDVAYGSGMMLLACLPASEADRFEASLGAIMTGNADRGATH